MSSDASHPFAVVIPTLNAAGLWPSLQEGLRIQSISPQQVLVMDSSSTDGTPDLARAAGYNLVSIARSEFSHGGTRQAAAELLPDAEIIVYLTQDATLSHPESIARVIAPFADSLIGATFGRQLPRPEAGPIEAHARLFNYPDKSCVRTFEDRRTLGIRAAFLSNSFSAYRRTALFAVGGFLAEAITSEDLLVSARMLMAGWKTAYVADALVVHSHAYSIAEEFTRYFDTGVCLHREAWLRQQFGTPGSQGKYFVLSELRTIWPRHFYLFPAVIVRTLSKAAAYYLGRHEASLSPSLRRKFSLNKRFWDKPQEIGR